ncbi:MAG: NAD(P)/FAD-dependent oxidoreductase [Acidobacteria bacterium]|nr:MAG: NAD(P)/FAD-dependent oxidoreductase [Acidobacteriota bacterium]
MTSTTATPAPERFDVLIVGAGISGLGAAHHLQRRCPERSFVILEGRERLGGTWDLFRYPGIRSDSDMYTLGYRFKPWTAAKAIADGPSILDYLDETARENDLERRIRFRHHVESASWSSRDATWTVHATRTDEQGASSLVTLRCNFLFLCSGYYDYSQGHAPRFTGEDEFSGQMVHPQFWPEDLDYTGQRVVVIGSGATAVTLVPAMAEDAAHVTMLQRTPTYVVSRPGEDRVANVLRRFLPTKLAYALNRWKNVLLGMYFYRLCRRRPEKARQMILDEVRKELGEDFDVEKHFRPPYDPWDQRMCLVPDGDLFQALRSGKASVVTDRIERFTESGIRLESGDELPADVVVTATGLRLQLMSGIELSVDGEPCDLSQAMTYKGMMFSELPNLALVMGYTNASWTLKADLVSGYVCRLLNHMRRRGYDTCRPRLREQGLEQRPFLDLTSGYVTRAMERFPKQSTRKPWRLYQNYLLDSLALRFGRLRDGVMEFSRAGQIVVHEAAPSDAAGERPELAETA